MYSKLRKRKSWVDSSGVSEIIGNILILMITVVLFSTIMVFVNQIPMPTQATKADFSSNIVYNQAGTEANLTITHAGGETLLASRTTILLQVDSLWYSFPLNLDTSFGHTSWTTGVDWARHLSGISYSSIITVSVYDSSKSSIVWSSQVSGGTSGTPPSILQRYVDSNRITPSVDPIKEGDDFTLFVKAIDLDNDLDSTTAGVWVDSTSIGGVSHDNYERTSGGWFEWDYIDVANDSTDVDGKALIIHARDQAGHESVSTFIISVIVLPVDIVYSSTTTSQAVGEGGLPAYLSWISQRQGFGVYKENLSSLGTANVSQPSTVFDVGERVFVRVASLDMANVYGQNSLELVDTRTGYVATPEWVSISTETDPFNAYASGGNVFVYEAKFNTSSLPPSAYAMSVALMSVGDPTVVFRIDQIITVTSDYSPITFTPELWTYSSSNQLWGTKEHPYEVSGTTYAMTVCVKVQNAVSPVVVSVGNVRIADMSGSPKVTGIPPSGNMISSVTTNSSFIYKFTIDLRLNNQDQWLEGTNAYTLFVSKFSDANEGVYYISKQVYVEASLEKADFIVGTLGMYASRAAGVGGANFQPPEYLFYIENNNFFTMRTLYDYSNSPGSTIEYWVTALGLGDLDGDGDKDLLMGQYTSKGLYYLENSLNTYGTWQSPSVLTRPDSAESTVIKWIATGDVTGDGLDDFAYATQGTATAGTHKVVIYNNTYGSTGKIFPKTWNTTNDGIRKIALEDMNGDGRVDLIVLAEGRVFVYDLKTWSTVPIARVPLASVTANIEDFDLYDVNGDGMLDILTTDPNSGSSSDATNGIRGVWINYYTANTNPAIKRIDYNATGYTPAIGSGVVTGSLYNTWNMYGGTVVMNETLSGGKVNVTMKTQTLANVQDQQLKIRARLGSTSTEVFYVWICTDTTTPTYFIPLGVISSKSYSNYTWALPSTVMNKAIYIRITDSSTNPASGSPMDSIEIDFAGIYTSTYGNYLTTRTRVVDMAGTSTSFLTVRGANLDGDRYADIVVAKNGWWGAYENTTLSTLWRSAALGTDTASFFVEASTMGVPKVAAFLAFVSPTLFDVVDVNGDGWDDIVVANTTIPTDILSKIGVFINLNTLKLFVGVKDVASAYNSADVAGGLTWILCENLVESD